MKDFLQTPLILPVLLVHPMTVVPKGLMESKVCPMDSFNAVFSPAFPSLNFVPKGMIDSTVKDVICTPLTLPLVLLVHPFPLSLRD